MKIFRHYKGGLYLFIAEVQDCTNGSDKYVVIYQSLFTGKYHVRLASEFYEKVPGFEARFKEITGDEKHKLFKQM
jgi:hypothetical protein